MSIQLGVGNYKRYVWKLEGPGCQLSGSRRVLIQTGHQSDGELHLTLFLRIKQMLVASHSRSATSVHPPWHGRGSSDSPA